MHISVERLASSWHAALVFAIAIAALVILATRRPRFAAGDALLVAIGVSLVVNDTPQHVAAAGAISYGVFWTFERLDSGPMRRLPLIAVIAALAVGLAGCGYEGETTASPETVEGTTPTETTPTTTTETTETTETETTETTETETTETTTTETTAVEGDPAAGKPRLHHELRWLSRAVGRRHVRLGRAQPRRFTARRGSRRRSRDERPGRHAAVRRRPDGAADRGRRGIRLLRSGQLTLLPPGFPSRVEALACDLDRTLIGADVELRPRTQSAIAAARAAGVPVVIATGRMFRSVRPYALRAGITEPVVCYQGAVVADPVGGEFLRHVPMPLDEAHEVIEATADLGHTVLCYVDDELYVARETPASDAYARFQDLTVNVVGDLAAWLAQPPTKLVTVGEPTEMDALEVVMKARFDGRLYIAKSLPHFLEFAAPEVTKAAGVAFVAERLGFSREATVAFGDGENDVELLEWAGYGIAVANAHRRVLAAADFVCPSVDEEGVAQVIEAFLDSRA